MFKLNERGEKVFKAGKESWTKAKRTAEKCSDFVLDIEDELVADDEVSCYNCRYRKWTRNSFICFKI